MIKNPQANAILECVYGVIDSMLRMSEINMADSVDPDNVDDFVSNVSWAICSTYHTVSKSSPGAAVFGPDVLFDILYLADWHKIGIHRQKLSNHNNDRDNVCRVNYDYVVGGQILICKWDSPQK